MSDLMSLSGYDCNNQGHLNPTPEQLDYHMPFTGGTDTFGMPITFAAYLGMLNNFYTMLLNNPAALEIFQGIFSIDFSKASLLRILSQPGCEFIRFYFAIPEANQKLSLLAEGIDIFGAQIGYDQLLTKATTNDMVHSSSDPSIEERGNGGGGGPLPPLRQLFDLLRAQGSPLATADLSQLS
ncbi:hypothetical protein CLV51_107197 [Chitinophaga niastensis]|uniref:Uncharacterized protein n=1 Tax=Chitinophaga niastensis TaxID=536980 RepID=A0A2P8HCD2_CHINA|nr:hypothetical protein [Chitinophaga niastensis]PSL43885.1 hypothetical protein CLV51_107197 [Chitinophaga niastensis]